MNNLINKFWVLFVSILCLGLSRPVMAQMAAATRVNYDIDKSAKTSLSTYKAWQLLKDNSQASAISNGYVAKVENQDTGLPYLRVVTLSSGNKRHEIVKQVEDDKYLLVYEVDEPTLKQDPAYQGLKEIQFVVTVKEADDLAALVNWKIKVLGKKEAKLRALEQLNKEIESYLMGFKKLK